MDPYRGTGAVGWALFRATIVVICLLSISAHAQDRASGDIEIITVRPNFYVLAGAGANIGVLAEDIQLAFGKCLLVQLAAFS